MEFRLVTKVTLVRVSNAWSNSSRNNSRDSRSDGSGSARIQKGEDVEERKARKKKRNFPTVAAMLGDPEEEELEEKRKEGGEEGKAHVKPDKEKDEYEDEEDEDAGQLELLRLAFRTHDLYFSHTCDVTLTAQRRADLFHPPSLLPSQPSFPSLLPKHSKPKSLRRRSLPLWQRADDRFFWNRPLLQPLIDASADEWVLPVMSAFVQAARNVSLSLGRGKEAGREGGTLVLVSRRSCRRQGRRFVKRGIGDDGHTANTVETEQIFITRGGGREGGRVGGMTSFVQLRGSIPLKWSSPANLKYTPPVHVDGTVGESVRAMGKHYGEMIGRYGRREGAKDGVPMVMMVNLIDKTKAQGRLGLAWEKIHALVMAALSDTTASRAFLPPSLPSSLPPSSVGLTWFDFHAECAHMRWDKLGLLLHLLLPTLEGQGFFHMDGVGRVVGRQGGVVRTNCMDCLDRTNVVQSVLARWSLRQQVQALLVEGGGEGGKEGGDVLQLPYKGLEKAFRALWGGNADAISVLYAGTPALKGDFTRTGRRTKVGMVSDGLNSAKRYMINNFVDNENQRAVEALLGRTREGGKDGWTVWPVEERGKDVGKVGAEGVWRKVVVEKGGLEGEHELDRLLADAVPPLKEGERVGEDGKREKRAKEGEEEGREEGEEGGGKEVMEKVQEEVDYYDEDIGGLPEWEREPQMEALERGGEDESGGEEDENEEEVEQGGRREGGKGGGWGVYMSEEMARDAAANAAQG